VPREACPPSVPTEANGGHGALRLCPPLVALAHRLASIADQARHSLFTCQRAKSRRAAYDRILAARFASELLETSPSKIERAQGRPGAGRTHGPPANKKQAASPQVRAEQPGLPCAMVLTVSFVLSSVTIAWLPPSPVRRGKRLHALDACIGASGPHDFVVRMSSIRLAPLARPSHPTANVRDDREAPLSARPRDGRKGACDLPDAASVVACGMLARRAICAWRACANCPSGGMGDAMIRRRSLVRRAGRVRRSRAGR
jgi:hypothetical protein